MKITLTVLVEPNRSRGRTPDERRAIEVEALSVAVKVTTFTSIARIPRLDNMGVTIPVGCPGSVKADSPEEVFRIQEHLQHPPEGFPALRSVRRGRYICTLTSKIEGKRSHRFVIHRI